MSSEICRLGILASHRGTNFQAIIDACKSGTLNAEVVVAISNNSASISLERARAVNIPAIHLSRMTHPDDSDLDQMILSALASRKVDLVVTAGYMKKLGPKTLQNFRGKVINIHPSLLPKHGGLGMHGLNVHKAVLDAAESETGITVHYVDDGYDTGEIISQMKVGVEASDTPETLAARVLVHEHKFLIKTLKEIICSHQQTT
jgi:phosphoribosylglycinamide formyltransferase 1